MGAKSRCMFLVIVICSKKEIKRSLLFGIQVEPARSLHVGNGNGCGGGRGSFHMTGSVTGTDFGLLWFYLFRSYFETSEISKRKYR